MKASSLHRSRRAFTLVEMLVVIAIIGILVGLLLPAVQYARAAARRSHCQNNLRQLALGLSNYQAVKGRFPLGTIQRPGQPCRGCSGPGQWGDDTSWYPLLFPYIEQQALYDGIDFRYALSAPAEARIPAVGDPLYGNWEARRAKLPLFGCPDDGVKENEFINAPWWARVRGNYVVNFGNTSYGGQNLPDEHFKRAPFGIQYGARAADIRDGLSNTLLMAEIIASNGDQWQGYVSDFTFAAGAGFTGYLTPNSVECDVVARRCSDDSSQAGFPCCTTIGNQPIDIARQIMASRSWHSGGVHASLCDGSVKFFSSTIDRAVWRGLASARGNEPVAAE